ncbi:hypothetical protein SY83_03995 [Paenibacillus swuensis]|uniref:DUF1835 domain-containing protein n=1 Tax=Paenibacillus swuensis TaxID=1178515 RepID=A0A172TEX6_9BACL|nr:DUF1835 domain-containing protein [Paenibacillus swuensis]ANE45599.1 hypothetical protein SY83_03995 [Paenibacillus swuensis]
MEYMLSWELCQRVHIVSGESLAGGLNVVLTKLNRNTEDRIICLPEQYEMGPLWKMEDDEGRTLRREWFFNHIENHGDREGHAEAEVKVQDLLNCISQIPEHAVIILWSANNAVEQMALRHAAYLLRNLNNEMKVLNAVHIVEEIYNTPHHRIDYRTSGEIVPDKLADALKEVSRLPQITQDERRVLEQGWAELTTSRSVLRIWEDDRIRHVDESHVDDYLLNMMERLYENRPYTDFIKAVRVIGEAMGYAQQYIYHGYYEYRLRSLIYSGKLESQGDLKAMRNYSVRLRVNQVPEE